MRRHSLSVLLVVSLLAPAAADATTLRAATTLSSSVVTLADLFDGAGPGGDRVLGQGPAPGSRIVVEAPQLAAIARQFGVDWRPMSQSDRIVIERPGRPMPRETLLEPLRAALAGVGAPTDGDINVPDFAAPMVALDSRPEAAVEQLDYHGSTGNFTASVVVTGPGLGTQRLRVAGQVEEKSSVVVPVRRLDPGSVLTADDLRVARIRVSLALGDVVRAPEEAVGHTLRHAAYPGQPIARDDVTLPPLVAKGAAVLIELRTDGLELTAQGLALSAGSLGARIAIKNVSSNAVLEAEITGTDRVRVLPGQLPLAPARNQSSDFARVAAR